MDSAGYPPTPIPVDAAAGHYGTTACYMLVLCGVLLPLASSSRRFVALPSCIFIGFHVLLQSNSLHINTPQFWPHLLPGATCVGASFIALRGDGGPLVPASCVAPSIGSLSFAILLVIHVGNLAVRQDTFSTMSFTHKVHILIYVQAAVLFAIIALSSALQNSNSPACAAHAACLRRFRFVHDPTVLVSLGLIFVAHKHSNSQISVYMHTVLGILLAVAGIAHACCICAHLALPRGNALCNLLRFWHALTWLLAGGWLCFMAFWLYLFHPSGFGLRDVIYAHATGGSGYPSSCFEETCSYVALLLWLCSIIIGACGHWDSSSSGRPNETASYGIDTLIGAAEGTSLLAMEPDCTSAQTVRSAPSGGYTISGHQIPSQVTPVTVSSI